MSRHPHRAPVATMMVAVVTIAVVVLGLTMVVGAGASTYMIDNCPAAPTPNGNPGPWTVFGAPQNTKGSCSGGPGSWIGPEGGSMPPSGEGDLDGVRVTVPAGSGITIREAHVWWFVPHQVSGATTYAIAADNIGEPEGKVLTGTVNDNVFVLPSTTTELTLADYCSDSDAGKPCVFGEGENPNLELFGAQLTLDDSGLPSGSVTGGGLAGAGPVSGTQALAYDAADAGSGVRAVELLVDGQPVAKNDYLVKCSYQNFAACPTSLSDTIGWNTAGASNGAHEVALRIVNAGGNTSIVDDHTITIGNGSPISGDPPANAAAPIAHIANGQSPCAGEALSLTVNGKAKPPILPYGRPVTVEGLLHCAGVPIRDARVQIATIGGPPGAAIDSAVQTGSDGSFSYKAPPGYDRTLRFSYADYSDDLTPSVTATMTISIRPKISLSITPHHTTNGHTMRWTGTIGPGPYPRQGVTLLVEVQEGRHWRAFDQVVANQRGQFAYSYRFHATYEPTTYTFRVALPDTGAQGYPYAPGWSRRVKVRVDP